jgi:Plasmid pRiA4b ORF-3-like protein
LLVGVGNLSGMSEPSLSSITIYQLRVVLCGVSPLVWRRLLVASDTTIAELHEILQSALDWGGEHLHCFHIHGAAYGVRCLGGMVFQEDARHVPLFRFGLHCGERFRYEYDFTADWTLDIRLEKALPFDQSRGLPLCIGGSRAAPPEDCAGAWDYLERLDRHKYQPPIEELGIMAEAVQRFLDSDGNRHAIGDLDELREAVDQVRAYQDFQPGKFDRRKLNRHLRVSAQDREVRR